MYTYFPSSSIFICMILSSFCIYGIRSYASDNGGYSLCMYVCTYVCICMYLCIYVRIYVCTLMYIQVQVCIEHTPYELLYGYNYISINCIVLRTICTYLQASQRKYTELVVHMYAYMRTTYVWPTKCRRWRTQ